MTNGTKPKEFESGEAGRQCADDAPPAAVAALLHLYTGKDSIEFDIRTANAQRHALALNFSANPSFSALFSHVRRSSVAGEVASEDSTAASEIDFVVPADLRNELISAFGFSSAADGSELSQLTIVPPAADRGFVLSDGAKVFEHGMLAEMALHLQMLADQARQTPGMRMSDIELLTDEEREILAESSRTGDDYDDLAIPELFTAQAHRTPHSTALIQDDKRLSFYDLNRQANQVAHYLRTLGVGPEVMVGFCFENSIPAVATLLGILKAGGAYVALDREHPAMRLGEIVSDANLWLILTDGSLPNLPLTKNVRLVDVRTVSNAIRAESTQDLESGCGPDSAAYVVYTSGSTGRPSGVIGIHRSVTNGLKETLFDKNRADEVSCLNGSLNVGFVILGLFLPLLSGVPLVIMSAEQYKDPRLLAAIVEAEKITTIVLPTPALRQILNMGQRIWAKLESLRVAMVGGSRVTPDIVEGFTGALPRCVLRKGYGSSEIGGIATRGRATSGNSVGKPISNTRVYILNKYAKPLPPGVGGDLYVAARHLARGYLNKPELTEARFLPDLLNSDGNSRMFKTGDLGRYTRTGEVEFLGRADDMVKIRGFRVQPGEVETVLAGHPDIGESVVVAREIEGNTQLVAYGMPAAEATLRTGDLRDYLRLRLPEYMVPAFFVILDRFPMTASGKVDRQALPEPGTNRPELDVEYAAPRNDTEEFLTDLWKELLRLDTVGIHDHFLELGGDSLFTVQVAARIWDRYELELPNILLFEHPTIAELAQDIMIYSSRNADF